MTQRRIVVTGVGVVAKSGIGATAFWSGLGSINSDGDWSITEFDPKTAGDYREVRRLDRFSQFAALAAREALTQAGLTDPPGADSQQFGVVLGNSGCGYNTMSEQIATYNNEGPDRVSPLTIPMVIANAAGAQIAIKYGWKGQNETVVSACASGTHALVNAWRLIASGVLDVALAGGTEAPIIPTVETAFLNAGALSPTRQSRPFTLGRDGFALSEGAACLVFELRDRALERGAPILAEVLGGWVNCDAFHISAPQPEGHQAIDCMQKALQVSGVHPDDISWVNAHGTGTPLNDLTETQAVAKTFGRRMPITSIKGATGHSVAGAGAMEAVATILSYSEGAIPPTVTNGEIDPEIGDVDVVTEYRPCDPGVVLSNSFGFGGHNATVLLAPPEKP